VLRRVVSIGALGLTLAACGGGKQDDLQDAIDHFNATRSSAVLETLARGGPISICRIHPDARRPDYLAVTAVTKSGTWLQATWDPDRTVRSGDVTTGSSYSAKFGADAEEQLRRQGRPCTVSPASGTISLD
jgi:hypothetical protein